MRLVCAVIVLLAIPQSDNRLVVTLEQLDAPVCVLHDAQQDIYFVSNINGAGMAKDNNGYISRITPDGQIAVRKFIAGGTGGATLHAPKGLAITGNDLWVADIDAVRVFDRRSGRAIRTIGLAPLGATFLNEMTVGPDQAIYVTDTALKFTGDNAQHIGPDRIFRITQGGESSIALEGDLEAPSGIVWDAPHSRFLIVALQGRHIFAWTPGARTASSVWEGIGGYDGIVLDGDRWLVSSLDGNGIYDIRAGREVRIIDGLTTPAAIGFDTRRRRLLIPSFDANTVQIWEIGSVK
jgi:sugar lactone lactonase YvrE